MNDRELLELAAKAAGVDLEWDGPPDIWQPMYYQGKTYHGWNPLTDDGDALRLAVKLKILIDPRSRLKAATSVSGTYLYHEVHTDEVAATRRAIVRAAAEIGRSKK